MEILLLLSVLFYKPIYYIGYLHFYKKDPDGLSEAKIWLGLLWVLINPMPLFKKDA